MVKKESEDRLKKRSSKLSSLSDSQLTLVSVLRIKPANAVEVRKSSESDVLLTSGLRVGDAIATVTVNTASQRLSEVKSGSKRERTRLDRLCRRDTFWLYGSEGVTKREMTRRNEDTK